MIWLRKELSAQPLGIFFTVALYAAPNFAIAVCPINWERFQIGVGIGYPLSMILTMQLYLRSGSLMASMPPAPPLPLGAYEVAMLLEVVLLLISVVVLIWHRSRLADLFVLTLSFVGGLVYLLFAFLLIAVVDQV